MTRPIVPRLAPILMAGWALVHPPTATSQAPVVYRVHTVGSIGPELSELMSTALHSAASQPGAVLILDVASTGGRVDIAQLMADEIEASLVPVYAMVTSRALSAAALVVLSTDSIYMVPGSSIGAGTWSELENASEMATLALRNKFGSLVERRGVNPLIGEAMVDERIIIRDTVVAGQLLTLDADHALGIGLAAAQIDNLSALLARLDLTDAEVVNIGREWTGTTVEVSNFNVMDVRIFLRRSGARYRLGTVKSMGSETFDVLEALVPNGVRIEMVAELIGSSQSTTTEQIRVQPGLMIQWRIEQVLGQSHLFYFVR